MQSKTNHLERLHSNRELQQDIDRLLWQDITAASSFADTNSKNILIKAAIEREKPKIQLWLNDPYRQKTFTFYHTFTEKDKTDLKCEITHFGVIRKNNTGHIEIRSTKTICVILTESDIKKFELFNAYPTVISPYGKKTNIDPTPYVRASSSWKTASPMRKAYLMAITCQDMWNIKFDQGRVAIIFDIIENDETFGKVIINETMATWSVWHEPSISTQRGSATTILKRAFPETFQKVNTLWDAADGIEIEPIRTVFIQEPTDTIIKTKENNTVSKNKTEKEDTIDTNARTIRAKKKAQARSKRNTSKQTKKTTKPKQNKTTTPKQPAAYKPTRVMTKAEKGDLSQEEINKTIVSEYLMHEISCANTKQHEAITIAETAHGNKSIYVMKITDKQIQTILDAWQKINNETNSETIIIENTLAKQILQEDKNLQPMYAKSSSWTTQVIEKIAQDADWQPIIPTKYIEYIENKTKSESGQPLTRKCTKHLNTSLMTRHDLIPRETIVEKIQENTPTIEPLSENKTPKENLHEIFSKTKFNNSPLRIKDPFAPRIK